MSQRPVLTYRLVQPPETGSAALCRVVPEPPVKPFIQRQLKKKSKTAQSGFYEWIR
jgi:hypothetical protein